MAFCTLLSLTNCVSIETKSLISIPFDQPSFWWFNGYLLAFVIAYGTLFLQIAAGQISFASENRSTNIRLMLVVIQFLICAAYVTATHASPSEEEWLTIMVGFCAPASCPCESLPARSFSLCPSCHVPVSLCV